MIAHVGRHWRPAFRKPPSSKPLQQQHVLLFVQQPSLSYSRARKALLLGACSVLCLGVCVWQVYRCLMAATMPCTHRYTDGVPLLPVRLVVLVAEQSLLPLLTTPMDPLGQQRRHAQSPLSSRWLMANVLSSHAVWLPSPSSHTPSHYYADEGAYVRESVPVPSTLPATAKAEASAAAAS